MTLQPSVSRNHAFSLAQHAQQCVKLSNYDKAGTFLGRRLPDNLVKALLHPPKTFKCSIVQVPEHHQSWNH